MYILRVKLELYHNSKGLNKYRTFYLAKHWIYRLEETTVDLVMYHTDSLCFLKIFQGEATEQSGFKSSRRLNKKVYINNPSELIPLKLIIHQERK